MSLIQNIHTFHKFYLRFSRFSGCSKYQCDSSSIVSENLCLKIQLGEDGFLIIKRVQGGFYLDLALKHLQVEGEGRYEFGQTKQRYFAYKFSDTLVEFLKVGDAKGVNAALTLPERRQSSLPKSLPKRARSEYKGAGYTYSAYTHRD